MRRIRYSPDVDALLVELSDRPIDHAEEEGRVIVHVSVEGEPVLLEIFDAKKFVLDCVSSVITEQEVTT